MTSQSIINRNKIILILIVISLLPLLTLGLLFKNKIANNQKKIIAQSYENEMKSLEQYLALQDKELLNKINEIASAPVMQELLANDSSGLIKAHIDKAKQENSFFEEIQVLSDKGQVVSSTGNFYNELTQDLPNKISLLKHVNIERIKIGNKNSIQILLPISATYNPDTCIGYLVIFLNSDFITQILSNFKADGSLILAILNSDGKEFLYSSSNLINNYNINALRPTKKADILKIGSNKFIFSEYAIKTENLFNLKVYIGMLLSVAYKDNDPLSKLFEQSLPAIILLNLVLIYFASNYLTNLINGQINCMPNLSKTDNQDSMSDNGQVTEKKYLFSLIEKIVELNKKTDTSKQEITNYSDLVRKKTQQINISLFNIKIELLKSGTSSNAALELIDQISQEIKQLQELKQPTPYDTAQVKLDLLLNQLSAVISKLNIQ